MMKRTVPSKIISLFMALLLVFSIAAVTALADEPEDSSSGDPSSSSDTSEPSATPESSPTPEATATPAADVKIPEATADFYIYDEDQVLSAETKAAILEKNKSLYERYGVQIVILFVKDTGGLTLTNYSSEVYKKWKIGGDSGNGILLSLDLTGDTYYALVGEGIKNALTNPPLNDMLNKYLEPDFAAKAYDAGVKKFFDSAAEQIEAYAATQPNLSKNAKSEGGSIWGGIGIFFLIVVIVLVVLIAVIYIHGQMVKKKRQAARAARAARRRSLEGESPRSSGGRLPDDLTSYHSPGSSKYDFDEFKPRK